MKLFKVSKEKTSWKDRAANHIGRRLLKWQAKCASKVNLFFATKSTKVIKRYLVIFCLTSGCLSGYVLLDSMMRQGIVKTEFDIGQTSVPSHIARGGEGLMVEDQ